MSHVWSLYIKTSKCPWRPKIGLLFVYVLWRLWILFLVEGIAHSVKWRVGFDSRGQGAGIVLLAASTSKPDLGPTQRIIQLVLGAISSRIKGSERETDFWSPSSAEAKNTMSFASTPTYAFIMALKHDGG